jgi:dephospho-CoA kinase
VAIVPLLFEAGMTDFWDAVICVASEEKVVTERLKQRGLSEEEAHVRIAALMPVEEKMRRADYVIQNNETLKSLERQTREVWRIIVKEEKSSW